MPRKTPRYGFIAETVTLTASIGGWTTTAQASMVNISRAGLCVVLPPGSTPPGVGTTVNVTLKPLLLHHSAVPVGHWTINNATVRWFESLPGAPGAPAATAVGLEFDPNRNLPDEIRKSIEYLAIADSEQAPARGIRPWVSGLNALGVLAGVSALVFLPPQSKPWVACIIFMLFTILVLSADYFGFIDFVTLRRRRP